MRVEEVSVYSLSTNIYYDYEKLEKLFRFEDFSECFCGPLKTLCRATFGPRAAICPPMAYCIE